VAIRSLFCALVVLSNLLSLKMVPICGLQIPAGLFTYPLTFAISNYVALRRGSKSAQKMVYVAFACALALLVVPAARLRVVASLVAFCGAHLTDIALFSIWKELPLWLRSNGSTWIALLVDTLLVDLLFLVGGLGWSGAQMAPVFLFSLIYKALFTFATTPLLYATKYTATSFLRHGFGVK